MKTKIAACCCCALAFLLVCVAISARQPLWLLGLGWPLLGVIVLVWTQAAAERARYLAGFQADFDKVAEAVRVKERQLANADNRTAVLLSAADASYHKLEEEGVRAALVLKFVLLSRQYVHRGKGALSGLQRFHLRTALRNLAGQIWPARPLAEEEVLAAVKEAGSATLTIEAWETLSDRLTVAGQPPQPVQAVA